MQEMIPKGIIAEKKGDSDFKYDQKVLVSKQKKLKLALQKSILNNTVADFTAVKHKGFIYQVGSFIELWDITLSKPFVGKLLRVVQVPSDLEETPFIEIQWCLKKEDLPEDFLNIYGKHISVAEVFPSDINYCLYVQGIKRKCQVISFEEYSQLDSTYDNIYFSRSSFLQESLTPSPIHWKKACYCDAPQNPDLEYIMCQKCCKWFHLECVSVQDSEKATFVCSNCSQDIAIGSSISLI